MIRSFLQRNTDIIFISTVLMLSAGLGSYYVQNGLFWYHNELMLTPGMFPDMLFSVVWTLILLFNSAAAFFLSRLYRHGVIWQRVVGLCICIALLQTAWSYLFFHKHMIEAALLDAIALQATILIAFSVTWSSAREIAYLLLPYALWVCIAIYLNYQVMLLNPGL